MTISRYIECIQQSQPAWKIVGMVRSVANSKLKTYYVKGNVSQPTFLAQLLACLFNTQ